MLVIVNLNKITIYLSSQYQNSTLIICRHNRPPAPPAPRNGIESRPREENLGPGPIRGGRDAPPPRYDPVGPAPQRNHQSAGLVY